MVLHRVPLPRAVIATARESVITVYRRAKSAHHRSRLIWSPFGTVISPIIILTPLMKRPLSALIMSTKAAIPDVCCCHSKNERCCCEFSQDIIITTHWFNACRKMSQIRTHRSNKTPHNIFIIATYKVTTGNGCMPLPQWCIMYMLASICVIRQFVNWLKILGNL